MFRKLKLTFSNPKLAMKVFLNKCAIFRILPDKVFLAAKYRLEMEKKLNLKNPQTFNEKLQWLKLHDRNPEYTKMADKYEVRKHIEKKIGEEYLIPLLGVWDSFEEIDFDSLPDQFVLKCTHDSGGLVICRDKKLFDASAAKLKIDKCMKRNYFWQNREWPYKNIKPRIIAEKFMVDTDDVNSKEGLTDYKFYCFGGVPQFAYVSTGLENHATARISFVTLDWEQAPFKRLDYEPFSQLPKKPENLEKMLELAKTLSEGISFLRVDFYEINDKIYFGELTFFPGSGMVCLEPEEWDYKLGEMIKL